MYFINMNKLDILTIDNVLFQAQKENKAKNNPENKINKVEATPTSLFFQYNTALGIIYILIIHTNRMLINI